MKQQTDWIEHLRRRLLDAAPTPPADGWERLETALDGAAKAPAGRRLPLFGTRRSWAAAAAVLLVGALLTTFYLQPTLPDPSAQPPLAQADTALPLAEPVQESLQEPLQESVAPLAAASPRRSEPRAAVVPAVAEAISERAPEAVSESPAPSERPSAAASSEAHASPAAPAAEQAAAPEAPRAQRQPAAAARPKVEQPRAKRTTALAFAGSALPSSSRGTAPSGVIMSDSFQYAFDGDLFAGNSQSLVVRQRLDYDRGEFDHSQPWSLGVNIRHGLGHGLSIESGLRYTQLRSKVTIHGYAYDQRLHLLGIPLHLNWAFVDRPRAGIYLGAGGMLERCLSARLGDESHPENRLQVSLATLLGAEYRFNRFAALYCEPELAYYLTETRLRTVRTDHPLTFTLHLGLRFTF